LELAHVSFRGEFRRITGRGVCAEKPSRSGHSHLLITWTSPKSSAASAMRSRKFCVKGRECG
jgi:hypothetical protein